MRFLLKRTLTMAEKKAAELLNSNGDAQIDQLGIRQEITTLTTFTRKIIEQKFFEFSIADYLSVDIGTGAWLQSIEQAREYYTGGSFFEGDINDHAGEGKIAETSAAVDVVKVPTQPWGKKVSHTLIQLKQAQAGIISWDIVTAKIRGLKKNWDLGVQETAMLGHPTNKGIVGLLTSPDVNPVTNLIPVPLSTMTQAQMQAFIAQVLVAYRQNNEGTAFPNKFVIPESDFLGLGNPFPGSVAQITMLEYLLKMFQTMTMNSNFKILPMKYCQAQYLKRRGENVNRYALYNDDFDTLRFGIPVDFNIIPGLVVDGLNYPQTAIGMYSGMLLNRPRELVYFDQAVGS